LPGAERTATSEQYLVQVVYQIDLVQHGGLNRRDRLLDSVLLV
jgi:hypothetical protein